MKHRKPLFHKLARRNYVVTPTRIHKLERLTKLLGGPDIFIKRDDELPGLGGGNKTRKLDYLVQDALDKGADSLITVGAVQSNHCRLTAWAARMEKLKCFLLLEERVKGSYDPYATGNNLLFKILGVSGRKVIPYDDAYKLNINIALQDYAKQLELEQGIRPYVIPGGGSVPLGATGYVRCAEEIMNQLCHAVLTMDFIVLASGSGGTHAGILAGLWAKYNYRTEVIGINVRATRSAQEKRILDLAQSTVEFLCAKQQKKDLTVICYDEYVGSGYSLPTPEMVEAVELFARHEGILLDPVYTGKAAAGMIGLIREGMLRKGQRVLFLHTGGAPGLYPYKDYFFEEKTR